MHAVVGFGPPPPHLSQRIALFAVVEGWLLLDIGWFVLFCNSVWNQIWEQEVHENKMQSKEET